MANYPVYQHPNNVRYPNPRQSVVNWASAGDKIMRGITEGINLGRKIKMQNELLRVSKVTTDRKQQETESQLALQEIQRKNANFDYTRKTNALSVAAEDAQQQAQLAKSQNYIQSNYLVAGMEQFSSDPDVIRANILTKGITAKTDPIEIVKDAEELRLLQSDEGSGIAKRLELQAEYQARNPTSTLAKALTIPDGNAITALLNSTFRYETGEMVPQVKTVTDDWGNTKDVVEKVKEVINYTEFLRRIKNDPGLIAKVLRESPGSAAWMKKNIPADTLKATGIKAVFTGTPSEWAETQMPAVTPTDAEEPGILSGAKVKVKIDGKDVLIDRPTGMFGGIAAKIKAGTRMDILRAKSETGTLGKILDAKGRGRDIEYWEKAQKELEDKRKDQKPEERAVSELLIQNIKDELTKKYEMYGIESKMPKDTADEVAANITKGGGALPVYTPEQAKTIPIGTKYRTADGRTFIR